MKIDEDLLVKATREDIRVGLVTYAAAGFSYPHITKITDVRISTPGSYALYKTHWKDKEWKVHRDIEDPRPPFLGDRLTYL